MKNKLLAILFISEFFLLLLGIFFDVYSTNIGIKDIYYNSWITNHLVYKANTVGTFTGCALIIFTIFIIFIPMQLIEDYKNKKISILIYLYMIPIFFYTIYLLMRGVSYIINFLIN
ncbi:hypothetical protein [Macrococcus animalis]|uniref:hypothetical protein n=1 Tax=Macrococcus animalis TaxID=3395467 RepID=UPI0039BDF184